MHGENEITPTVVLQNEDDSRKQVPVYKIYYYTSKKKKLTPNEWLYEKKVMLMIFLIICGLRRFKYIYLEADRTQQNGIRLLLLYATCTTT